MKNFTLIALIMLAAAATSAQTKKHSIKKSRAAATTQLLKTKLDSISYAAGMNQVRPLKALHTKISVFIVEMAIRDSLTHIKSLLSVKECNDILENLSKRKLTDSTTLMQRPSDMAENHMPLNRIDSISYAFGLGIAGGFAGDYGIKLLNYKIFNTAIEAGLNNQPLLLTTLQARKVLSSIYRPEFLNYLEASKKFLAANKKQQGVVTLPDGLQYMILKPGSGANVMMGDSVSAHYKGTLIDGKQFDSSYDRGEPLKLTDITRVITGWTEGLQLMNLGAKYRFFIPPNLAYGSRQRSDIIAPYSALIFDVEVVKINNRSL